MAKELLKGNIAFAEAAIRAGCEVYFGYPITPQTELLEHMSQRMVELGRVFLQAESEVAAVNMVYGAAAAGARVMTSSSSPGISLMQEGFSYMAASNVPAVVIDIMRGGPGLGNIQPSQSDYNQVTKSAGHGDFHPIVLAPSTVQEAIDLTTLAFDLAEKYRTLVFVIADGTIGQMMEPAELPEMKPVKTEHPAWAVTGAKGRPRNVITSLFLGAEELEKLNIDLQAKLLMIQQDEEVRYDAAHLEGAEVVVVGFGTAARVAQTAVNRMRAQGLPVGLFRPITLWPFPEKEIAQLPQLYPTIKTILVVEMNAGQMVHDVREAIAGQVPVRFTGRMGGIVPVPEEVEEEIRRVLTSLSAVTPRKEASNGRVAL
ncbi:MAG: 3-methyl-2-oxobutanoate dehydrogenase subunit VorB [Anaerolineae bacterium]|nr:3-methyl-2-oxobutanoate dehydrogenase subunit VorB [Anaerolineae bacterium]